MGLFIFRFWPALIPLLLYMIWMKFVQIKALNAGEVPPRFRDGPLYKLVLATLAVGIACYVWLGVNMQSNTGEYVPPRMENGVMQPGYVKPNIALDVPDGQ